MSQWKDLEKALEAELLKAKVLAIDPANPSSRASEKQQPVLEDTTSLHIYCIAGNQSGKSQMGARIITWKFNENHPYWSRKPEWGDEPLLLIVAGRISDQVEELWRMKIKPFLEPGTFKEVKQGPVLKYVEHKINGNKILFTSHDKAEQAKEKIQSYVAHHFWLDEMPSHESYIEEAHRRVDARQGQFFATFTPKVRNDKIREMVDNSDPLIATIYRMGKLDNPIYHGREDVEWAKVAHMPERVQRNIMFGDWLESEDTPFPYNKEENSAPLPDYYSSLWPHLVAYDPANSSNSGLVTFAYDHKHGQWWVVDAQYKRHNAPSEHIDWLEDYLAPLNVDRRVCDNEPWFYNEYSKQTGTTWMPVVEKNQRKKQLIANVQEALHNKTVMFKAGIKDLEREFQTAEWKPGYEGEKLKNSQRFHLLDALQYGYDMLPKLVKEEQLGHDARMIEAHIATQQVASAMRVAKNSRDRKRIKSAFNRARKKNGWFF